jgi:hypothetical protein
LVFISQYLHEADSTLPHPFSISHFASLLEVKDGDGPTIVPQGQGRTVSLGQELRSKLNTFCILNTAVMRPWVDRHQEARATIQRERARIRREHGRRAPLPGHLSQFPATITADWVHAELDKLDRTEQATAASITQDEWEYARGCNPTV